MLWPNHDISGRNVALANQLRACDVCIQRVPWYVVVRPGYTMLSLSLIHISEPTRPERISYAVFCLKKKRVNDSTGYTLVEPRHIRVPFVYRHYTHAADWPAPHFTLICRGSARDTLLRHSLSTNCTLLLRTCTLIRREIAGNKTLPPDHGITRHKKPQRPPDHGHNTA